MKDGIQTAVITQSKRVVAGDCSNRLKSHQARMVASSVLALVLSMMWESEQWLGSSRKGVLGWFSTGPIPCYDYTGAPEGTVTQCRDASGRFFPCSDSVWTISTTADTSTSYDESSFWQEPASWVLIIIALTLLFGILFICWASAQPTLIRVEESQVAAEARVPGKAAC